jgi:hypothetical protein
MKLQRREKILISVAGGLFVTILGFFFFLFGDVAPPEKLLLDRSRLKDEVKKKEAQVRAAKEDKVHLED